MREASLLVAVLSVLLAAAIAAAAADANERDTSFCGMANDTDVEMICEMMQKWDSVARKDVGKRQAFNGGGGGGPQGCKNLQCFCAQIGNRGGCGQRAFRREYRMLSDGERQRFHNAMIYLRNSGQYNQISWMHTQVGTNSGAHSGPGFLPWHREYMKRMELALRAYDPSISLPYWDSVLDSYLPNPSDSVMFSAAFMGEAAGNGQVVNGLGANFGITRWMGREGRMFSEGNLNAVYQQNAVQNVLAYTAPFGGCPYPVNFQALEYTHAFVHLYVGGDMKPPTSSANDPIFFLHHCFVDLIWENWRQMRQSRPQREQNYPPDHGNCMSSLHFSNSPMRPWPMQNREGLANYYTDNIYSYAARPTCSAGNPNCGSPYLFCDTRGWAHCVSKIKMNGRCSGFEGFNACWGGTCQGGWCRPGGAFAGAQQAAAPTFAVTARPAQAGGACANLNPQCDAWARTGACRANAVFMNRSCRRSCNLCGGAPANVQNGCVDRNGSCAAWRQQGFCNSRRQYMSLNCQRSCGFCGRG